MGSIKNKVLGMFNIIVPENMYLTNVEKAVILTNEEKGLEPEKEDSNYFEDDLNILFIPKVVPNKADQTPVEKQIFSDLNNIKLKEEKRLLERLELVSFLPIVTENKPSTLVESSLEPSFYVHKSIVSETNINLEEEDIEDLDAEVQIDQVDWDVLFSKEEVEIKNTVLEIHKKQEEKSTLRYTENESFYFPSNFLDEDELNTMVLLEDISDMGDTRDLPLLRTLRTSETNTIIVERIEELISKLTGLPYVGKDAPEIGQEIFESVFEKLLNIADRDTEMFLIQEMARVGDHKEITLLENRISGKDRKISGLAKNALERILERETK